MIVFTVVIVVLLLVAGIMLSGKIASLRRNDRLSAELRELLLARAKGSIDEEAFERRQAKLHATLLEPKPAQSRKGWWWAIPVLAVVGGAATFYTWQTKKPEVIDLKPVGLMGARFGSDDAKQANSGGDLSVMVNRLAEKMVKDPQNGDGWLLLARTYNELHQPKEAAAAYAKAAALLPPDATLLADWADAQVMANGGKWDGAAKKIVERALEADPKHLKSLALAGSEAFYRADYKSAMVYWKRMQAAAPAGSMDAKLAEANLQEAEAMLSGKKPVDPKENVNAQSATSIAGTLTLNPRFKGQVAPSDTVFVLVRAPDGSNPPLAVKRFTAADLPLHFSLDDSAAMIPGRNLSKFGEVLVSARISKSGHAMPAPGDIEAKSVSAKVGSAALKLELSSVR